MRIPKILYGTGKEVHPRVTRWMRKVKKAGAWPVLEESDFVDTADLVREGLPPFARFEMGLVEGGKRKIRFYAPGRYFKFSLGKEVFFDERRLFFDGLVNSDWGLLALISESGFVPNFTMYPDRVLPFFKRLVEAWPVFLEERELFYQGERKHERFGSYFWNGIGTSLWSSMVNAGLPIEVLREKQSKDYHDYQAVDWIKEYILDRHR